MPAQLSISTLLVRCCAVAALFALGACGDSDPTPIVPDTSTQALSLAPNHTGGGASASD